MANSNDAQERKIPLPVEVNDVVTVEKVNKETASPNEDGNTMHQSAPSLSASSYISLDQQQRQTVYNQSYEIRNSRDSISMDSKYIDVELGSTLGSSEESINVGGEDYTTVKMVGNNEYVGSSSISLSSERTSSSKLVGPIDDETENIYKTDNIYDSIPSLKTNGSLEGVLIQPSELGRDVLPDKGNVFENQNHVNNMARYLRNRVVTGGEHAIYDELDGDMHLNIKRRSRLWNCWVAALTFVVTFVVLWFLLYDPSRKVLEKQMQDRPTIVPRIGAQLSLSTDWLKGEHPRLVWTHDGRDNYLDGFNHVTHNFSNSQYMYMFDCLETTKDGHYLISIQLMHMYRYTYSSDDENVYNSYATLCTFRNNTDIPAVARSYHAVLPIKQRIIREPITLVRSDLLRKGDRLCVVVSNPEMIDATDSHTFFRIVAL